MEKRPSLGFTLVETLVVLCILALVASGSLLVMSSPLRRAANQGDVERFRGAHQWMCDRSGASTCVLTIDLDQQTVVANAGGERKETRTFNFDGSLKIGQILVDGAALESGSIDFSYRSGGSQSYALLFENARAPSKWLFICGATGCCYEFDEDELSSSELQAWMAQWANLN